MKALIFVSGAVGFGVAQFIGPPASLFYATLATFCFSESISLKGMFSKVFNPVKTAVIGIADKVSNLKWFTKANILKGIGLGATYTGLTLLNLLTQQFTPFGSIGVGFITIGMVKLRNKQNNRPEKKLIDKFVSIFKKLDAFQKNLVHPRAVRERALGKAVRALGRKLGVKIREKTFRDKYIWSEASEYGPEIRAEVIEKFQYFVEKVKVITSRDRKFLLKALIKYRKARNQPSLKSVPNKQEWQLTQIILRAIWSEKGKFLSMRGLSKLIFNTKNYFLRFSEGNDKYGQGFEAHQVAIMEEFLSDYLTGTNKKIVIDAIIDYKIATDKEGFYSSNTPEMILAQFIRTELMKIYGELSMKEVGRKLGKYWFFRNVKSQNRPFKQSELWHIARFMHQFALTSNAPQYVSVLKALGEYRRSYHWYHRVTEKAMLRTLLITGPTATGYAPGFSSPLTRRLQSEILMRQFCDRDAYTGDKIIGTPHRHHIEFIKSLCQIKDLAPLSARSHGIITGMAQRGRLQEAIDIISRVKEAVETLNFGLLRDIWSDQNIIDFQRELATYTRDDIDYYINRLP